MSETSEILLNSTDVALLSGSGELQKALVIKTKTSSTALESKRKVSIGLVKSEDEKYLTGTPSDRDKMVKSVSFKVPEIKQTIEARIDEQGYIYFNTENAVSATKEAMVKIITLVCTPVECVKSTINIRLHPLKGFIKSRNLDQLDMSFGDEIEPINIANLYTVGNTQSQEPENENKKEM